MKLTNEQHDLVDFAYRINSKMGANLSFLFQFGVVYITVRNDYMNLLNHLRTNKNFGLQTGFDNNHQKMCIWLDTVQDTLKEVYKSNGKIEWTVKQK
jgi:hypothetical protein